MILRFIFSTIYIFENLFCSASRQESVIPDSIQLSFLIRTCTSYPVPDITDTLRYDRPTIILHWTTAFLVLLQVVLGEFWSWPSNGHQNPSIT